MSSTPNFPFAPASVSRASSLHHEARGGPCSIVRGRTSFEFSQHVLTRLCRTVIDSVGPVSSPTRRHVVNLARAVDLFRRERKKLRVYPSFDPLEWVEASTMVAAKGSCAVEASSNLQAKLRVLQAYSKLRSESKVSLRAYSELWCERTRRSATIALVSLRVWERI